MVAPVAVETAIAYPAFVKELNEYEGMDSLVVWISPEISMM
jgi:hypothetical protein